MQKGTNGVIIKDIHIRHRSWDASDGKLKNRKARIFFQYGSDVEYAMKRTGLLPHNFLRKHFLETIYAAMKFEGIDLYDLKRAYYWHKGLDHWQGAFILYNIFYYDVAVSLHMQDATPSSDR